MIGKRKRDTAVKLKAPEESSPPPADNAQDVFRKYFEAQFKPLDLPSVQTANDEDSEDLSQEDELVSESEWSGLDDGDDKEPRVQVVEHKNVRVDPDDIMDKKARKAFMNAKPPSLSSSTSKPATVTKDASDSDDDKAGDAENLKHDLALQRLLRESHLLESASDLAPTGKNRLKALDLRMQAIGAKTSLYKQEKMPSSHRRGIKAKAATKEEKRRREAKENGIILEKPAPKVSKSSSGRRERGVGGPTIGKFAGGTLNLGKRDLAAMQGPKRRTAKGGRGGRGGKSRRGGSRTA
ncbi:hypothetical protein N7474_001638 [Penicillium riverlandense]|uniref:uncharacterized protein n=1 Tax=Penicillium riverlandense TaxID=1903569 RepID=UPI002547ACE4|nr:uncharacterized protein N7474_001638 [Penicillium riverlandense]KAJ5833327.1 hypothetical protein N7474_001638 [Penicillium riverlandense]